MTQDQRNPDLSDEQQRVLFESGTEQPGSGQYLHHNEQGMYTCANCGAELFRSDHKYDSKTPGLIGWPSFSDPANNQAVALRPDTRLGMVRTEVVCAACGGHLGHVFDADDAPNGGRHYCINSVCLGFNKSSDR